LNLIFYSGYLSSGIVPAFAVHKTDYILSRIYNVGTERRTYSNSWQSSSLWVPLPSVVLVACVSFARSLLYNMNILWEGVKATAGIVGQAAVETGLKGKIQAELLLIANEIDHRKRTFGEELYEYVVCKIVL
jgi:hypothetical protein